MAGRKLKESELRKLYSDLNERERQKILGLLGNLTELSIHKGLLSIKTTYDGNLENSCNVFNNNLHNFKVYIGIV